MPKKKINQAIKGFTMIEIIVVLFVVSIGIVGVMSLIVQNIKSQSYDKNTLIASQLAQEGIELIRGVRDSNWKANRSFATNLTGGDYYMDYLDTVPQVYSGTLADLVLKQNSLGFYLNNLGNSASSTIFSRLITLKTLNIHSLQVDSTVSWNEHGSHSYNLQTLLYDWK